MILFFIDGSHKKENVMKDIINSLSRLEKDGLILLHDYYPNGQPLFENKPAITGPYLAVKELLKNIDFEFKIVPEYLGQTMSFALIWKKRRNVIMIIYANYFDNGSGDFTRLTKAFENSIKKNTNHSLIIRKLDWEKAPYGRQSHFNNLRKLYDWNMFFQNEALKKLF